MSIRYDTDWERAERPVENLNRLTAALAKGLHVPVSLEESPELVGFVIRLDDAPFGPLAVIQIPGPGGHRVCRRDPEELRILAEEGSVRILDAIVL